MKPERRHPQAVALNKWFRSKDGIRALGLSILSRTENLQYLENRLRKAFGAGWDACKKARSKP